MIGKAIPRGVAGSAGRPLRDGSGCRGGEIGAAEDPGTIGQGMDPEDLAGFCRAPECLGGDVKKLRGFVQLQPGFDPSSAGLCTGIR